MAQELQHSSQALRESGAFFFRQLSDVAFEAIFCIRGPHCGRQRRRRAFDGRGPGGLRGTDMLSWVAPGSRDAIRQRIALRVEGTWGVDMVDAQGQLIAAEASVRQRESWMATCCGWWRCVIFASVWRQKRKFANWRISMPSPGCTTGAFCWNRWRQSWPARLSMANLSVLRWLRSI